MFRGCLLREGLGLPELGSPAAVSAFFNQKILIFSTVSFLNILIFDLEHQRLDPDPDPDSDPSIPDPKHSFSHTVCF
jgi:hypothetical protein